MRSDWDTYFMKIAAEVSTRATCPRKSVGAVIVRERRILTTGYNGAIVGANHCTEDGCDMEDGHCVRAIHAEQNAIFQAAALGVSLAGATCYTTVYPCWPCARALAQVGIVRVVYMEVYRVDPRVHSLDVEGHVLLEKLP